MKILMEFDKKQLRDFIDRFVKMRKAMGDLTQFWRKRARPILISRIKTTFDTKGYGTWAPRKDNLPHPLLIKTKKLYGSWTKVGSEGNIYRVSKDEMEWGSDIFYGVFHETGTDRMPARPIAKRLMEYKKDELEGALGRSLWNYLKKEAGIQR